MNQAPLIGIPALSDPGHGPRPPRFSNNQVYTQAVLAGGGVPVLIPLFADLARLRVIYARLDGLLLPGGVDVDPALYGETPPLKPSRPIPSATRLSSNYCAGHSKTTCPCSACAGATGAQLGLWRHPLARPGPPAAGADRSPRIGRAWRTSPPGAPCAAGPR